jgi:hypothetical protein
MSHTPSAILAVSSTDRYTVGVTGGGPARKDSALLNLYEGIGQPGNQFQISSSGAFIYGYIKRIVVSQVQVDYRIPTIVPSNGVTFGSFGANDAEKPKRLGNNIFPIAWGNSPADIGVSFIELPYGFYTPEELASMLTVLIRQLIPQLLNMTVIYGNAGTGNDPANPNNPTNGIWGYGNSFTFFVDVASQYRFFFPSYAVLKDPPSQGGVGLNDDQLIIVLKTYRLFGITVEVSAERNSQGVKLLQTASPTFLYTPYIDIVSNNLTKFQKVKDSDTTPTGRVALISRVYLSGVGAPVNTVGPLPTPNPSLPFTSPSSSPGCEPFIMTADLNNPKVIRWNKDETVYNMDFTLYDQYGDLIYWTNDNPTEFQMTLLCQEEDD